MVEQDPVSVRSTTRLSGVMTLSMIILTKNEKYGIVEQDPGSMKSTTRLSDAVMTLSMLLPQGSLIHSWHKTPDPHLDKTLSGQDHC